ncbi:MAG: carbohydrate binding domain-containing protein [Armatimonadetes bacterium]|nr:carbohydrate binding domain-containing protein [Armatimonadota bacterium]
MRVRTPILVTVFCLLMSDALLAQQELFPFVVPWDAAPSGVADMSGLLHRPAGRFGYVRVGADGHFYVGAQRIRFWGVNMTADACFQHKDNAPKVAARLARAGVNIVRFHHMDAPWSNPSLINYSAGGSRQLNAQAMDNLHYFFHQLKREGIYANINLLVHRRFSSRDGLPAAIDSVSDMKDQHVIGTFYQPMIELQKEYARLVLTHRNPYTGMTYAQDPAVAFVEINNENGLIHGFLGGVIDRIPPVFRADLQRQWNRWLLNKYRTTSALRRAWGERSEPLGQEMLNNGRFTNGLTGWTLEQHAGAQATATQTTTAPTGYTHSVHIRVTNPGSQSWHVQLAQAGLRVVGGRLYTLSFWARADANRTLSVAVTMDRDPWQALSPWHSAELTPSWRRYEYTFTISQTESSARLLFSNMGTQTGSYWITGVSLRPGGTLRALPEGQSLEAGNVAIVLRRDWGATMDTVQRDWLRFLRDTEERYWTEMYNYLKRDLGVAALVTGTIVGCTTPNLMARMDLVDTHSYWQHPEFPGGGWDNRNWFIRNLPMVNERGGTIAGLATKRVLGKPHTLSEYNHPAPNTYTSEGLLLIAAYGLLQDWDAIYFYTYAHRRDNLDARRITGYFDIDQHPTQWVAAVAAGAMFLRGDVARAQRVVGVTLNREQEIEALRGSWAWRLVDGADAGLRGEIALRHRLVVAVEGQTLPAGVLRPGQVNTAGNSITSDTGQLRWDWSVPGKGVVSIAAPMSKAVVGFGGGRRFDLGDGVVVEPGTTRQNGFGVIALTVKQGSFSPRPTLPLRALITATGYVQNTGWGWRELGDNRVTLGENWGTAPTLVEGVPARITLPIDANMVEAYALDERGDRKARLPVSRDARGNAVIQLSAQYQTLWYEVVAVAR